jgi:hypothetical protein
MGVRQTSFLYRKDPKLRKAGTLAAENDLDNGPRSSSHPDDPDVRYRPTGIRSAQVRQRRIRRGRRTMRSDPVSESDDMGLAM